MKIAIIVWAFPPKWLGGTEIASYNIARTLVQMGHEVHIITSLDKGLPRESTEAGFYIHRVKVIHKPILFALSFSMPTFLAVKKIKPDILHVHYAGFFGFLGALSGFHPLILSAMGSDILVAPSESRVYRMITSFAIKKADMITTPGENLIDVMMALGADSDKIKRVHPGVDTKLFKPLNRISERELLKSKSPTVISIRSLQPIYDVETLIKSVPIVLNKLPEVKFIIGGDGIQRSHLRDLAKFLGVLDSVSFTGTIPHDKLPEYFNAVDVYVSTSLSDGGPSISLVEAMACGLACVVTDVGDVTKWIENGENGFVVPVNRPDLLAEHIVFLLENDEFRKRMGRSNLQLVEQRANYEKEMAKMAELYKDIANLVKY